MSSPRPLPPELSSNPAETLRLLPTFLARVFTASAARGQRASLAIGNRDKKTSLPSRQVKVQDAPIPVASSGRGRELKPSAQ